MKYKDRFNTNYLNVSNSRQKKLFEKLNINVNQNMYQNISNSSSKHKSNSLDKNYFINKKKPPMQLNYYGKNYIN